MLNCFQPCHLLIERANVVQLRCYSRAISILILTLILNIPSLGIFSFHQLK